MNRRCDARGAGLQRLGAADLAAVGCHSGVVRHVLRLERDDADAAVGKERGKGRPRSAICQRRSRCPENINASRRHLKLDAFLRFDAGREVVLHGAHLGDAVGERDQFRLGVAACHDDVEIGAAIAQRFERRRRAAR